MALYAVTAQVLTHADGYHGSKAVPSFYLDSVVSGIVSAEHAARVAADVLNPLGLIPAGDILVTAEAVPAMVR